MGCSDGVNENAVRLVRHRADAGAGVPAPVAMPTTTTRCVLGAARYLKSRCDTYRDT